MTSELLPLLQHSTLLLSLALLAVLALRGAWLRCFGPGNIMLLWLSVPATLLALLVPAPVRRVEVDAFSTFAADTSAPLPTVPGALSEPAFTLSGSELLAAVWLVGVVLTASFLVLSQWRFRRSLGRLERRPDGSFRSESSDTGPALVGALRPRIVVPADFDRRYTAAQQFLIMKHERCHLKRGDAQFTLLACLLRSLFWFNPLVHLAWSRFRTDQELACDAAVLRAHPESRREYAEAMVSTHFKAPQLPVGCTWQTGNPLKRRITMLYTQPPGKLQILAGTMLALSASTAAAVGAWSSQEPQRLYAPAGAPQPEIATVMTSSFGSAPALPRLSTHRSPTGPGLATCNPTDPRSRCRGRPAGRGRGNRNARTSRAGTASPTKPSGRAPADSRGATGPRSAGDGRSSGGSPRRSQSTELPANGLQARTRQLPGHARSRTAGAGLGAQRRDLATGASGQARRKRGTRENNHRQQRPEQQRYGAPLRAPGAARG